MITKLASKLAVKMMQRLRSKATNGRQTRNSRKILVEQLENRQLMASDMLGAIAPDGVFKLDLQGGGVPEIDRKFGAIGDKFVVGDWRGQGHRQIGAVHTRPDGFLEWRLNSDSAGDSIADHSFIFGLAGDVPVVGDWNGDGTDNAGVVRKNSLGGLTWYLDLNGDPNPERIQNFGLHGDIPVVGDWDNNGTDNVAVVRNRADNFMDWHLDTTGDAWPEVTRLYGLRGDAPVVGDWNQDGRIDIGVARPVYTGVPLATLQWHRDTNGDPLPDLPTISFGSPGDTPVVGNWNFSEVFVTVKEGTQQTPVVDGQAGARSVQFGSVPLNSISSREFTISNRGNAPLVLGTLSIPNGWTSRSTLPSTLQPGAVATFVVDMDTTTGGSREGQISFTNNDGNESPFNFVIRGQVGTPTGGLQIAGQSQFGIVTQGVHVGRTFTLTNTSNKSINYRAVLDNSDFSIVSGGSGTIAAYGGTASVSVVMNSASLGPKRANLIASALDGSIASAVITLSGSVVTEPAPTLTGNGNFGSVNVGVTGAAIQRSFVLSNPGSTAITFNASLNNTDFRLISAATGTVPAQSQVTITIAMNTAVAKNLTGLFKVNTSGNSLQSFSIALTGNVVIAPVEPAATLTGNGNFGSVYVGTTGTVIQKTFVLSNPGSTAITFNASLNNTDFRLISAATGTVPARGQIVLTVAMNTAVAKTLLGILRVNTGGSNPQSLYIALNGKVTFEPKPADVGIRIGEITLIQGQPGLLYYGASSSFSRILEFTIVNTGDQTLNISNPQITGLFSHNMPSLLQVGANSSKVIRVTMNTSTLGTKIGTLTFSTNDPKEPTVRINLLGRQLEPITQVGGSATSLPSGTLTIHSPSSRVFVDHSHGPTSVGGAYKVTNGSVLSYTSSLTRIIINSSTQPTVENWTDGVAVLWQRPTVNGVTPALIELPKAKYLNWFS